MNKVIVVLLLLSQMRVIWCFCWLGEMVEVLHFGVVEVRVMNIVRSLGVLWSTVMFGVLEGVDVGVSGGIWWL